MTPKELVNLMYSPLWTGKLIHHFISGVQSVAKEGIKTELIYLVLPFLSDETIREKLCTANKKSTIKTVFKDKASLEMMNAILKKNDQINKFKKITNDGLIYLGNYVELQLGLFTTLDLTIKFQKEDSKIREHCKASYYLGVILAKENYINTIHKLGITTL